ncbi:MAG: F0F1 ATP synthase subunit alpha, partial [Treponema sp.]|nr:F0F1 ATP synthase subunit alpha [Treponema sp.]
MANFGDLVKVLQRQIEEWETEPISESVGVVTLVGDSVATVFGLDSAVYGELIEFASGATGVVLNLEEDGVGVVLLTGESSVKDGDEARGTGRVVSVPSGNGFFGRVVDPLGNPV